MRNMVRQHSAIRGRISTLEESMGYGENLLQELTQSHGFLGGIYVDIHVAGLVNGSSLLPAHMTS